jgi:hypothetical protein
LGSFGFSVGSAFFNFLFDYFAFGAGIFSGFGYSSS